jgi:hypothetical protein
MIDNAEAAGAQQGVTEAGRERDGTVFARVQRAVRQLGISWRRLVTGESQRRRLWDGRFEHFGYLNNGHPGGITQDLPRASLSGLQATAAPGDESISNFHIHFGGRTRAG